MDYAMALSERGAASGESGGEEFRTITVITSQ
jgi:hypothetical protein